MTYTGRVSKSEVRPVRRVSRQREAGEVTRAGTRSRVLTAAREEFAASGYASATVKKIADRADVSVQSLYSSWGSKRELLRGVMIASLTGDRDTEIVGDSVARNWEAGLADDADGATVLGHVAAQFCRVAAVAGIGWRTYLEAVGTDPDIAADWQQLMEIRRSNFRTHIDRIDDDELRPGLTRESATDTAWAIASPQLFDLLVRRAGYTMVEFESWLTATLRASVLR
jgi:AcrR family transcriptional regulator